MADCAYYNENDEFAAAWLRNLIQSGLVAPGDVDARSIVDVRADDLRGYRQCHFFAGIGVWSYALRLAGWSDDRHCWTGSCPCGPFSGAGDKGGFDDERHLWPELFRLIRESAPRVVFGEQVASPLGLAWLDLVQADLEGEGYASAALDLCAAGFGAPHIRQRLYWMAHAAGGGPNWRGHGVARDEHDAARGKLERAARVLVDDVGTRLEGHGGDGNDLDQSRWIGANSTGSIAATGTTDELANDHIDRREGKSTARLHEGRSRSSGSEPAQGNAHRSSGNNSDRRSSSGIVADAGSAGSGRNAGAISGAQGRAQRSLWGLVDQPLAHGTNDLPGPTNEHWRDADWLLCRDGKWRPVEPGTFPLAHGAPARVGRLRGYGNAIVAQCAQAFIEAAMEVIP